MTRDKKILYIISTVIFAVLLSLLFLDVKDSKLLTACILVPMAVIVRLAIRKRCSYSVNKKEVLLLSAVIAVLFVIALELSGLYFGFYKNPYFVNEKILLLTVLPTVVIIVATELIRSTMLDQKNAYASFFALLTCLTAEVLAFSNLAGITSFNRFMDLVGMTLFPAISANIYCHYASKHFGWLPGTVFRLITTLYVYFTPSVTAMSDALVVCAKIFIPIVMLLVCLGMYSKNKKTALKKKSAFGGVLTALSVVIVVAVAMLISCQFRFGAIVVATESMTGEINKGDMIIYERYDDQEIKEGQVIVFLDGSDNRIIHRVTMITQIGNEIRYFTKGDANDMIDDGYRTEADIVGLTDIKVAYIGYPTLWLRSLLEGSK